MRCRTRRPGVSKLTSLGLTATGVYYQDIDILRQVAALLGKQEDSLTYTKLAEEVKASFTAAFFNPAKNHYDRNSQTANAMPLFLGLVAPDRQAAVLDNVVGDIRASGNRITAGDVGFYYVVQAFLNGGRSDVLYDMLLQTNGPGYSIKSSKALRASPRPGTPIPAAPTTTACWVTSKSGFTAVSWASARTRLDSNRSLSNPNRSAAWLGPRAITTPVWPHP